jgi:hypothetical protein
MGDMNNIMHVNEKLGPTRADIRGINAFYAHLKECGFIDFGYSRRTLGPTKALVLILLIKDLIVALVTQNGAWLFPLQLFIIFRCFVVTTTLY